LRGFPGDSVVLKKKNKTHSCQCRRQEFDTWVRKIPWIRKCEPTPGLPGKSHGQRSVEGYSPWGRKKVRHDLVTEKQRD